MYSVALFLIASVAKKLYPSLHLRPAGEIHFSPQTLHKSPKLGFNMIHIFLFFAL